MSTVSDDEYSRHFFDFCCSTEELQAPEDFLQKVADRQLDERDHRIGELQRENQDLRNVWHYCIATQEINNFFLTFPPLLSPIKNKK